MINRIVTAIFVVVLAVSTVCAQTARSPLSRRIQRVTVSVTERGYRPMNFRLQKGVRARLTFVRKTEDECGREVVFPAYNIRRELPFNKPVVISFTPRKTGTFSFTCGMDMMRGRMIVR